VKHLETTIDLNLLRVFDALWHTRKVVAAAERLQLTPPAVSNALARLRRATGDELFTRTPQGMLPTPHAQAIAPALTQALAAIDGSLARPARFVPRSSGRTWRIAMTDIGEIVFLPRLLAALAERAPQALLHTVRNRASDTRAALTEGSLDLAVGWLLELEAGFHRRRLFEQRYVLLMAAAHPLSRGRITPARLATVPQVQVIERQATVALPHFAALPWVLRDAVRVAVVPHQLAAEVAGPLGLVVRELPAALPRFEVSLVWHHRTHAEAAHRWMRGLWVELFS
jgi:DNA-binding transcriptional LysR family regulator